METLYTRRNSHIDVNIICVPYYFSHPVVFVINWFANIVDLTLGFRTRFLIIRVHAKEEGSI